VERAKRRLTDQEQGSSAHNARFDGYVKRTFREYRLVIFSIAFVKNLINGFEFGVTGAL
jgi:hypothetical protein